jgi:drug/metabolite transporter (DMT)-like permease
MSHPIASANRPPAGTDLAARRRRAILCVVSGAACFAVAAVAIKALGGAVPVMQLILFRNLFAIPALVAVLLATTPPQGRGWQMLATRNPLGQLQRIAFGVSGTFSSFYGYVMLPLATVTALGFTMPLFLTALSVPLLGEKVGWRRASAVAVGFLGVLLILRPWAGDGTLDRLAIGIVLAGALAWAMSMITIRRMGEQGESATSIVLWFAIGGTVIGGAAAIPGWVWPDPLQLGLLVAVGVISAVAQLLITTAYRSGETTLIAPFEYSGILWTSAFGMFFWGETPGGWDLAGIAVLVCSGLYIWHRETRLGLKR